MFSIETPEVSYAYETTIEVRMWRVPAALTQNWAMIKGHMAARNVAQVGKPYARFEGLDWEVIRGGIWGQLWQMMTCKQRLVVGICLAQHGESAGDIKAVERRLGRVVSGVHKGAHHSVAQTYRAMLIWAEGEGITLSEGAIETYLNSADEVAVAELETRIWVPIAH